MDKQKYPILVQVLTALIYTCFIVGACTIIFLVGRVLLNLIKFIF